jgi:hypothetical protein
LAAVGLAAGLLPGTAAAADPFRPVPATPLPPATTVRAAAELPTLTVPPIAEGAVPAPAPVLVPGRTMTLRKQPGDDAAKGKDDAPKDPADNPADRPDQPKKLESSGYVRLPTRGEVFRLDSDPDLERRILKELGRDKTPEQIEMNRFPNAPQLAAAGAVYRPKTLDYPPVRAQVEPGYVVHRRLYFEERNSERYGWDMGVLQPAVSTLHFYKDVLFWPLRLTSNPHEHYDVSAGKCLPGDPVPYYLYPPEIDLWGAAAGVPWYVGLAFIFP